MADGDLTLKLDDETAQRLKDAAAAAGRSVNDYVRDLIREGLTAKASDEVDWAEDLRILADYDRTGVSYSVEEGIAVFDAAMKVYLARLP